MKKTEVEKTVMTGLVERVAVRVVVWWGCPIGRGEAAASAATLLLVVASMGAVLVAVRAAAMSIDVYLNSGYHRI